MNKNLHYLTDRLPKSNYENGYEIERTSKLSQSSKPKNSQSTNHHNINNLNNLKGINLPKLDRIIVKSNNYKIPLNLPQEEQPHRKPYNIDGKSLENMLKIEGKGSNNNVRYDY